MRIGTIDRDSEPVAIRPDVITGDGSPVPIAEGRTGVVGSEGLSVAEARRAAGLCDGLPHGVIQGKESLLRHTVVLCHSSSDERTSERKGHRPEGSASDACDPEGAPKALAGRNRKPAYGQADQKRNQSGRQRGHGDDDWHVGGGNWILGRPDHKPGTNSGERRKRRSGCESQPAAAGEDGRQRG